MATRRYIRFAAVLLAAVVVLGLSSCAGTRQLRRLRYTSFRVMSFSPRGLRSANAVLAVGVTNPGGDLRVSGLEGVVKKDGKPFAQLIGNDVLLSGSSAEVYELPCTLSLVEGVNILTLLNMLGSGDFSNYRADISMRVGPPGAAGRKVKIKNLKLSDIIR